MDLRTWIADDHTSLRRRFDSSIAGHVPRERWKEHADGGGSCIAWLLLHIAYHEDLALTTAVRNHQPLIAHARGSLGLGDLPAWEGLPEAESPLVVERLDIDALDTYAREVHAATAAWISALSVMALDTVPDSAHRLERLAGVTHDAVDWLHDMWDGKPVSWFVQWECIAHGHTHLGEMVSVRNRLGLSPF